MTMGEITGSCGNNMPAVSKPAPRHYRKNLAEEGSRMSPDDMVIFFLQVAVMLFTALFFGQMLRKFHFPAVIGELIGGIVLGPTVWGWLSPGTQLWLFPVSGPGFMGMDALVRAVCYFSCLPRGSR